MSSQFVGLPISVELSNGAVVEGTVLQIDQSNGKLNLGQARYRRFDGTLSPLQENLVVDKDSVKDLTLLSVRPNPNVSSPGTSNDQSNQRQASNSRQACLSPELSSPGEQRHHGTPRWTSSQPSSHLPSQNSYPQTLSLTSTTSTPETDVLANSVVTITNQSRTGKPSRRRRRGSKNPPNCLNATTAFRGSSTGGESGFSAREDTDGIPTPEPSPAISIGPETAPTSTEPVDFNLDFDFQAGLRAFDKAKLWAEIASTDSTDPADRLVAYNRKKPDRAPPGQPNLNESTRSRNLGPNEMVLSAQEQLTNGTAVSASFSHSPDPSKSFFLSSDGHPIFPIHLDRLNQALTRASVEHGPNVVQRVENASRTTAEYVIRLLRQSQTTTKSFKNAMICIIVGCQGNKGSCAIRTGTLLAHKGFRVVLMLGNGCGDRASNGKTSGARSPQAFKFQLRLFNSTNADIVTDSQDLPPLPTIILEALAENSTTPFQNHDVIDKTLIAYTHRAPTLSIDIPSYLSYDTGEPLVGPTFVLSNQYLICLAALPKGVLKLKTIPSEICLADLTLPNACWNEEDGGSDQIGNDEPKSLDESDINQAQSLPPSTWGDEWYTLLKI